MTKTSQTETTQGTLKSLALSSLSLSPLNPRQEVSDDEVASLAESIKTVGLIQPIAGLETKAGVEIVAGGRRLRALRLAAADLGQDAGSFMVNVTVTTDAAQAQSWASTENVNRKNLHPAQEVAAYADMIKSGSDEATVAKAFGVTVRHVKGRMKLAVLPDVIMDALRADDITLDVAAAYTVAESAEQAEDIFEQVKGSWEGDRPYSIRAALTTDAADADSKLATFIGREAYEAAGGTADVQIKLHPDKMIIRRDHVLGWSGILIDEHSVKVLVDDDWIRIDHDGSVKIERDAETTYLEGDGSIIRTSPDAEIMISSDGQSMSRRTGEQIDAFTPDGFVSRKRS